MSASLSAGPGFHFPTPSQFLMVETRLLSKLRAQDAPGHTPPRHHHVQRRKVRESPQNAPTFGAGRQAPPSHRQGCRPRLSRHRPLSHGGIGIKENWRHCRSRSQKSRAPGPRFGPVKLCPGDHFALAGLFSAWSPRSSGSAARLAQHGLTGKAHLFVDHIDGQRQLEPGKPGLPGHGGDKPAGRLSCPDGKGPGLPV